MEFLIDRVKKTARAAGVSTVRPDNNARHIGQHIGYHCSFSMYLIRQIEKKLGITTTGNLYERLDALDARLVDQEAA